MQLSKNGFMEIVSHEAMVQTRYKDSKDVWTIGIGHTKSAGAPNPQTFSGEMPLDTVISLFRKDLEKYEARVNKYITVELEQHEFDALVSFDFNTGGVSKATLVKKLNAGDKAAAAKGFMNWVKPAEIGKRRKKEQILFSAGKYSGGGKGSVIKANSAGKVLWPTSKSVDLKEFF